MAAPSERRGGIGGISTGGILVIIGIIVAIVWSLWLGLIIALIGLIAFGGFARGRWYCPPALGAVRRLRGSRPPSRAPDRPRCTSWPGRSGRPGAVAPRSAFRA